MASLLEKRCELVSDLIAVQSMASVGEFARLTRPGGLSDSIWAYGSRRKVHQIGPAGKGGIPPLTSSGPSAKSAHRNPDSGQ